MEEEAARADDEVADEGDEEDAVMVVAQAVVDALEGQVDEEQVRQRVDDLGSVDGCVVVLSREGLLATGLHGAAWLFGLQQRGSAIRGAGVVFQVHFACLVAASFRTGIGLQLRRMAGLLRAAAWVRLLASSHQLSVLVTGLQKPSCGLG